MSVGRSGLAASMAWEMIIHSQPWVHMVEKSSGLMALHADNDKMPLDMVFRVGSKVEQPWLTALQKAAECELEQLKNRSWPLHGARALPLLATKSLLAASCVFLVCGSWLTSKATLSLILAMDAPMDGILAPLWCTSWQLSIMPALLLGWQRIWLGHSVLFQAIPYWSNVSFSLLHLELMGRVLVFTFWISAWRVWSLAVANGKANAKPCAGLLPSNCHPNC